MTCISMASEIGSFEIKLGFISSLIPPSLLK